MKPLVRAAFVLLGCSAVLPVAAAPGDVYVPAHRTANGLWVPANVPPSSGGTRMTPKLASRAAKPAPASTSTASPTVPPLFVAADPIRR